MTKKRKEEKDTIKQRIEKYERRVHMTNWVAGGLGSSIIVLGTNALEGAPDLLINALYSLIVAGAVFFGFTRVGFEWKATVLKRKIKNKDLQENGEPPDDEKKWPSMPETMWYLALWTLILIGGLIIVGVWWK